MKDLVKKAAQIRLEALLSICKAGKGHTGSCMSVTDILVELYYGGWIQCDPMNPGSDEQDYLVLSKGHAAPVLYAILADLGFFDKSELNYIGQEGALLTERPNVKIPGVNVSTLTYGHGLSAAFGLALALKMDGKPNKVYCVLGDAELQCGQVWEAAMAAAHHHLDNLVLVIDNNKMQTGGLNAAVVNVDPIQAKFDAFGWKVIQVRDSHNFDKLFEGFAKAQTTTRQPICLWCHTITGKGIEFAEGKIGYKGVALSEGELSAILPKLQSLV